MNLFKKMKNIFYKFMLGQNFKKNFYCSILNLMVLLSSIIILIHLRQKIIIKIEVLLRLSQDLLVKFKDSGFKTKCV